MRSTGKHDVVYDARNGNNQSVIVIRCTWTVYERADKSKFAILDGKRVNLQQRPNGDLFVVSVNKVFQ